jgi:hypothetical protein
MPLKYSPLLHAAMVRIINRSINTRSAPYTPWELVAGTKYSNKTIPFAYGSCHMVTSLPDKRRRYAQRVNSQLRYVPKVEVGVCLGPCPLTGGTRFLTESGDIGPKVIRSSLDPSFIPFNWPAKSYVPITTIPVHRVTQDTAADPAPALVALDNPSSDFPVVSTIVPPGPVRRSRSIARIPHRVLHPPVQSLPTSIVPSILPVVRKKVRFDLPPLIKDVPPPIIPTIVHTRRSARLRHATDPVAFIAATSTDILRPHTITRKLDNQRKATARNATHRRSLNVEHLNDRPASCDPTPPPPATRCEVSVKQGILLWGAERVRAAIDKETKKILVTYKSMQRIDKNDIKSDAVYLRSMLLIKEKSDGSISARMPIDGKNQPTDSYGDTFAETTDITDRLFILSTVLKDAADCGILDKLEITNGDIPAAFINANKLSQGKTGQRQFITRFPKDHPDPTLAGQYFLVTGAQYGMKQSNNIYDQDLDRTMLTDTGYESSPLHPRAYVRRDKDDSSKYSIVIFYSDDFEQYSTCPNLKQSFKDLMISRYGADMKISDPGYGTTGLEYTRNANYSITISINKYIQKQLTKAGMDTVEAALQPSLPNLFHVDATSHLLDFKQAAHFRTINGGLIWMLPVRFDISKEVRWLCSRNKDPTFQDRAKQIHLLRYLKGAPNIGPTYNGYTADAPGIRIEGVSDVGHAVHPESGASQIAFQVSVGETNAPFKVGCFAESGLISPDPTSAEYIGIGTVTKEVLYWRQVAESLGFPQTEASVIRQDNNSAINLTVAPQVTRRMRFTAVRHHHVRSAYKMNIIRPVYTNTNALGSVDMLTKSSTLSNANQFLYNRSMLFNDRARTYTSHITI